LPRVGMARHVHLPAYVVLMAPTPPGTDRAALRLLPAPTPVTWREEILTGTSSICTAERAWERERGEAGWELQPLCGLRLVRRQQCCRGRPGGSPSGARMPWGSRELSDARAVLQSTAVYCSLLQSTAVYRSLQQPPAIFPSFRQSIPILRSQLQYGQEAVRTILE
jgi:hypothetical protein